MKGKDGGAAKVLRREWALRRLPRWGRGVRRRTALRALRPSLHLRTVTFLWNVPVLRMAYLNKRATCVLLFKTHMLQVRCAHPAPSHRNAPSGHSGVLVGLFYAKSTQYSLLQNARPPGSLRSPYGYRGVEDPFPSVHCGCRNVKEGDAAENGGEERRKVVEIMTCL